MEWATTQNNLGLARRWLGDLTDDLGQLDAAQRAYDLCLTERSRHAVPFLWAVTQWNLADLALVRHRLSPQPAQMETARAHLLAARENFADGSEHQTARCDELIAKVEASEKG
ncbi:MAG: hypothetical protein OEM24_13780 [Paracoccaceae bacterium]|nr:hypothetical protein [Paracoccaceae bacterium]